MAQGGDAVRVKKETKRKPPPSRLAGKPAIAEQPASPEHGAMKKPSMDVLAYEAIKDRILTLFFLPGQYVNEGAVGALLGMGRTPVHQAMQRLQVEELVEIVPRKGVIIRPDSAAEILKILESRETVEPDLARHAAEKSSDSEARQLRVLARAANKSGRPLDGQGRIDAFIRADRAFHARVAVLSGNSVLAEFAGLLHDRCMRFWYLHLWQTLDTKATANEHSGVADAIVAHDGAAAAHAMRKHIQTLKARVAQIQHNTPSRHYAPHQTN